MRPFGTVQGRTASLYELENDRLRATVMDYGGALVSLETRDAASVGVVLGFDCVEEYAGAGGSFGALLGRNANRISGAPVTLDGRVCELSQNEGGITLHGGKHGFGRRFWEAVDHDDRRLRLHLRSVDGDQGFPGTVEVTATYALEGASLSLVFEARTDKPTFLSLSSHPYFNLDGELRGEGCLDHEIMIAASRMLATDARQLPTGELRPVDASAFDFRQLRRIGDRICWPDEQLQYGKGYDHCFVLDEISRGGEPIHAATARSAAAAWCSSCSPRSAACSSIPQTTSTARSGEDTGSTGSLAALPWSRRVFPMRRTTRISRRP